MRMIELLKEGRLILNVDESWVAQTNFTRKLWVPANAPATVTQAPVTPRLSLIVALDSEGRIFYSMTQAATDQNVMMIFLIKLVEQLDIALPDWRDHTALLLDNATYHQGARVREYLRKLKIEVIWSGPYSYDSAPCELVFAQLKLGELNQEQQATGKKGRYILLIANCVAFQHVVKMVGRRLASISRSTCVRFWHHTLLELYKYIYYDKI